MLWMESSRAKRALLVPCRFRGNDQSSTTIATRVLVVSSKDKVYPVRLLNACRP